MIDNIITFIKKLLKEADNFSAKGLLIRGKDDLGFEHVYNQDTFIQKLSIELNKLDSGKFDSQEVRKVLLKSIQEIENAKTEQKR